MKKGKFIGIITLLFVLVFGSTITVDAAFKLKDFESNNLVYFISKKATSNKAGEVMITDYENKTSTDTLKIPDIVEYKGSKYKVITIYDMAFKNSKFKRITLPDTIKEIKYMAFKNCTNLEKIEIANGVKLDGQLFWKCTNLKTVVLPNDIEAIPPSCFYGCTSLININIPDNVTTINQYAFYECKSLQKINLPININYIGMKAFEDCNNLTATIPKYCTLERLLLRSGINYNYSDETYFNIEPVETYTSDDGMLYYKVTNTRKNTFYNLQVSYSFLDSNNLQVVNSQTTEVAPIFKSGESAIISLNTQKKQYSDVKLIFGASDFRYKSKSEYITATMENDTIKSNASNFLNSYNITINSTSNLVDYVKLTIIFYKDNKVSSVQIKKFTNVHKGTRTDLLELPKETVFDNYEIKIDAYNNN